MSIVDDFPAIAVSAFDWLTLRFAFRTVDQQAVTRKGRPMFSAVTFRNHRMFVAVILECPQPFLPTHIKLDGLHRKDVARATAAASHELEVLGWSVFAGDDRVFDQLRADTRQRIEDYRLKFQG